MMDLRLFVLLSNKLFGKNIVTQKLPKIIRKRNNWLTFIEKNACKLLI